MKRILRTIVMLSVATGVITQLYGVLVRLVEEQGLRASVDVMGRTVNVAAALVMAGLLALVLVIGFASWWSETREERALMKELEGKARARPPKAPW